MDDFHISINKLNCADNYNGFTHKLGVKVVFQPNKGLNPPILMNSAASCETASLSIWSNKCELCPLSQTMQGSDCIFEAVEQQDLDTVQILLYQFSAEELDLNTPNSQGLTPLDIAIMTNNTPIAKLLLKAGGKESPHCEFTTADYTPVGGCVSLLNMQNLTETMCSAVVFHRVTKFNVWLLDLKQRTAVLIS